MQFLDPTEHTITAYGETGMLNVPLRPEMPVDKVIENVYTRGKNRMKEDMEKEVERDVFSSSFNETTESINGFEYRVVESTLEILDPSSLQELYGFRKDEFPLSNRGKLVVFNYFDRAILMIWSVTASNVHDILETLKESEKSDDEIEKNPRDRN